MPKTIFIVDDDPDDRYIYQLAIDRSDVDYTIKWFSTGQELLAYLEERTQHSGRQNILLPSLILLDIYMPGLIDHEAFEELHRHIFWNEIPVMLVTSSAIPDDITKRYAVGIEHFVEKPSTLEGYIHLLKTLEDYVLL